MLITPSQYHNKTELVTNEMDVTDRSCIRHALSGPI